MLKPLSQLYIPAPFLNNRKAIVEKNHSQHDIEWGEVKVISSKIQTRQECTLSPLLLNSVLKILTRAILQEFEGI